MTIEDIRALIHDDETRTLEMKKTTGELKDGMRSVCAFLNTAGGWLFFGIAPTTLKILGQEVTDNTRKEIAREIATNGKTKFAKASPLRTWKNSVFVAECV